MPLHEGIHLLCFGKSLLGKDSLGYNLLGFQLVDDASLRVGALFLLHRVSVGILTRPITNLELRVV